MTEGVEDIKTGFIGLGHRARHGGDLLKVRTDVTVFQFQPQGREKLRALLELGHTRQAPLPMLVREVVVTILRTNNAVADVALQSTACRNPRQGDPLSMSTVKRRARETPLRGASHAGQRFVAAPVFGRRFPPYAAAAAICFNRSAGFEAGSVFATCKPLFATRWDKKKPFIAVSPAAANLVKLSGIPLLAPPPSRHWGGHRPPRQRRVLIGGAYF